MNAPDKKNYLLARVRGWIDPKRKRIWNHSHFGAQVRCFGHDLVSNRARDREQPRDMRIPAHLPLRPTLHVHVNQASVGSPNEKGKPKVFVTRMSACGRIRRTRSE